MKFPVSQLDRIILALLDNAYNKKFVGNVSRLFSMFDQSLLQNEYGKEVRVFLIREMCNIINNNGIVDREKILTFMDVDGRYSEGCKDVLDNIRDETILDNDLKMLDKIISDQLRYAAILSRSDKLNDMLTNIKAENYQDLGSAVLEVGDEVDTLSREIKSARESIEDSKHDLSLSNASFVRLLDEIINDEKNPSTKVQTGIQYLNKMLDGGFEKGRLYCALGVAKGWKSGFLLNCVSWAKRYNVLTSPDPELKPVIVYLSMENNNKETTQRIWCHCFGNNSHISDYTKLEAANMLEKADIFTPNDPSKPEILIWYRSNRSISTSDLNVMLEDLKREGKYCAFLVLDYLKRIRPAETNKDLRLELANITNELKTIATEQNIPIVTAMQLKIRPVQ